MTPKFLGTIEKGKLTLDHKDKFELYLGCLEGRVELTIKKYRINGLTYSDIFADWLKSLVDDIATSRSSIPLTLVLVGIPERRYQLIKAQPSLDRVFDIIEIQKFSENETNEFFSRTFGKVNVSLEKGALQSISRYSGGYPVIMHEIGDAVFTVDNDNTIDLEDAARGIFISSQIIGNKYIEPKVLSTMRSEKYQSILKKIAKKQIGQNFTRQEMISYLNPGEVKVFDNFINKMHNLDVIMLNKEYGPGNYKFTSEIYHLFFSIQAALQNQK